MMYDLSLIRVLSLKYFMRVFYTVLQFKIKILNKKKFVWHSHTFGDK